jgi:Mg2+ and Co2+ transporter CorA
MKLKKIKLEHAILLKERLENDLYDIYRNIRRRNIQKELEKAGRIEEQLIEVKEAIQRANLSRGLLGLGHSNSYYIYKLSNLKMRKNALSPLEDKPYVSSILRDINTQIETINDLLTKFNSSKTIKITE